MNKKGPSRKAVHSRKPRSPNFGRRSANKRPTRVDRHRQQPLIQAAELNRGPRARFQALQMLVEADESNTFIDNILERKIHSNELDQRDRYLIQEVAYGAIRHRNTIDHLLEHYIQFSMRRHNVVLRWGLRLAAYQLVYLSRIPAHAAIHGTLEAMKAAGGLFARDIGFSNAVLRRFYSDIDGKCDTPPEKEDDRNVLPARHGWCRFKRPVLPAPSAGRNRFLSVKYSHPKWLLTRWVERFGEGDAIALCLENNRVPLVTAILRPNHVGREEVIASLEEAGVAVESGTIDSALRLRRPGDIRRLEPYEKGWISIQGETANQVGKALDPPPGAKVLDLCSAPGSKAAQLLEQIGPHGHLTACDIREDKLLLVKENLDRVGEKNYTLLKVPKDPGQLPIDETFTHILVDAPCSNTGVLARRPEARWRIHVDDFPGFARFQNQLLEAAVRRLAPKGRLVYATCSIEPDENGQVVAALRRKYPALKEMASRLFLSHRDGSDGGYYTVLEAPQTGWTP